MSIHDPRVVSSPASLQFPAFSWRARRARKQEEALLVRETDWALEQVRLQGILTDARHLVEQHWTPSAWSSIRDDSSRGGLLRGGRAIALSNDRITGSCVVAALIRAGGGTTTAHDQPVQRALDAAWHALHRPEDTVVQWCPPAMTRLQHLRDLTRWNDDGARSVDDVAALLLTAERVVLFSEV